MSADTTKSNRHNTLWLGLIIVLVGTTLLFRELGLFFFPGWLFTWPMILVLIGVAVGAKNRFEGIGWLVLVMVGAFFLLNEMHEYAAYLWSYGPALAIIVLGLYLMLRPHRRKRNWGDWNWEEKTEATHESKGFASASGEDYVDLVSVFGGNKKRVFSKHFRGGDSVSIFGGNELDLTQADIDGTAVLDIVAIFGGVKLTVPANWQIQSEVVSIFGGLGDKRNSPADMVSSDKRLIITGACILGGIEIKSY